MTAFPDFSSMSNFNRPAKELNCLMRDKDETPTEQISKLWLQYQRSGGALKHLSTIKTSLKEDWDRKYIDIYSDFLNKWKNRNSNFDGFTNSFVFDNIKKVVTDLLFLNPKYVKFELTEDNSVFFQSLINDCNVYLELFFTDDTNEKIEAVVNIYQNNNNILAYGGAIKNVFDNIRSKCCEKSGIIEDTATFFPLSEPITAEMQLQEYFQY